MCSTILQLGPFALHSYGLMLALAFLIGIYLVSRQAKKEGISPQKINDLALWIILSAIVGSRLFYVLFHLHEYLSASWRALAVWEGGLNFYGGVIFAIPTGIIFLRKNKFSVLHFADLIAPAFAFGLGLARIGCFLNGCCFGEPTNLPWGIIFPPDSLAGSQFPGVHLHPTQLYESLFGFLTFFLLFLLKRHNPLRHKHGGQVNGSLLWLFIFLYSGWRFLIEFIRSYEREMIFYLGSHHFTLNQVISLVIILFCLALLPWLRKKES